MLDRAAWLHFVAGVLHLGLVVLLAASHERHCLPAVGGLRMTNERFHRLFGGPPREPRSPLTARDMDLAASVQAVTQDAVIGLARALAERTGETRLCLAGGVALNCVANGKLSRNTAFERIFVQPAAGDAGGALGAAYAVWHTYLPMSRSRRRRRVRSQTRHRPSRRGPVRPTGALRARSMRYDRRVPRALASRHRRRACWAAPASRRSAGVFGETARRCSRGGR